MATSTSRSRREESAKAVVTDQTSQTIQSTSNLLYLVHQSSSSQADLKKLPRNLLAKTATIKHTELMLKQMPGIISSVDAHVDNGLNSVTHLRTATELLSNMQSCQLKSLEALLSQEAPKHLEIPEQTD